MQTYSDIRRATDPRALPDVEVFHVVGWPDNPGDNPDTALETGWYWWPCFPGCLPDSEPNGPFETQNEAVIDAQSNQDDDDSPDQ